MELDLEPPTNPISHTAAGERRKRPVLYHDRRPAAYSTKPTSLPTAEIPVSRHHLVISKPRASSLSDRPPLRSPAAWILEDLTSSYIAASRRPRVSPHVISILFSELANLLSSLLPAPTAHCLDAGPIESASPADSENQARKLLQPTPR